MAQKGSQPTPERNLLKIIEGTTEKPRKGKKSIQRLQKLFSLDALKARLFFIRDKKILNAFPQKRTLSLREVNHALMAAALLTVLLTSVSLVRLQANFNTAKRIAIRSTAGRDSFIPVQSSLQDIDFYTQLTTKRDYFKPTAQQKKPVKPPQEEVEPPKPKEPTIVDKVASLSLVGVSWSRTPEAMVEDAQKEETYFVREGDMVAGGVTVKKIFRDKIVLLYKGEETSLRY